MWLLPHIVLQFVIIPSRLRQMYNFRLLWSTLAHCLKFTSLNHSPSIYQPDCISAVCLITFRALYNWNELSYFELFVQSILKSRESHIPPCSSRKPEVCWTTSGHASGREQPCSPSLQDWGGTVDYFQYDFVFVFALTLKMCWVDILKLWSSRAMWLCRARVTTR